MMAGALPRLPQVFRDAEHADLGEGDESVPRLDLGVVHGVVHADQGGLRGGPPTS